jgi:hypothetical protein
MEVHGLSYITVCPFCESRPIKIVMPFFGPVALIKRLNSTGSIPTTQNR